jgi:hypothetical protein
MDVGQERCCGSGGAVTAVMGGPGSVALRQFPMARFTSRFDDGCVFGACGLGCGPIPREKTHGSGNSGQTRHRLRFEPGSWARAAPWRSPPPAATGRQRSRREGAQRDRRGNPRPARRQGDAGRRRRLDARGPARAAGRLSPTPTSWSTTMAGRRCGFRELTREQILEGVTQNMVTPLELIQAVIDPMPSAVSAASSTSPRCRSTSRSRSRPVLRRARRADRLPGRRGTHGRRQERHHQPDPARQVRHRPHPLHDHFAAGKAGMSEEEQAARRSPPRFPRGRLGTPEEFGNTCAFLCSAHAGYITGQNSSSMAVSIRAPSELHISFQKRSKN